MTHQTDKQYRMSDVFELPLKASDRDYYLTDATGYQLSINCEGSEEEVAHAINTHDAMQDRIAELEQERVQLKCNDCHRKADMLSTRGRCVHCEASKNAYYPELQEQINQLKAQNNELKNRNEQLADVVLRCWHEFGGECDVPGCDACQAFRACNDVLDGKAESFIAEIQAKAIEGAAAYWQSSEKLLSVLKTSGSNNLYALADCIRNGNLTINSDGFLEVQQADISTQVVEGKND
jgi:hypothetical protein